MYTKSKAHLKVPKNIPRPEKGMYRGADKSSARPGRKQPRNHVGDAHDFTNIETQIVKFFFLQGKALKEIQAILTETLVCFLPGRAKDLSTLL